MKISNLVLSVLVSLFLFACGGGGSSSGSSGNGGDSVIIKFTVANLPATIPINQDLTADSNVEYEWLVEFDINKNGVMDAGDVSLSIEHLKTSGSSPMNKSVTELDMFLNEYESETVSINTQLTGAVSISDSTIIMTVPKYESQRLENMTRDINVHFATLGIPPSGSGYWVADNYPTDAYTFTAMTADGKFTDGDDAYPSDIQFVDLVSMEVIF